MDDLVLHCRLGGFGNLPGLRIKVRAALDEGLEGDLHVTIKWHNGVLFEQL
jgi:hypothetical protein